MNSEMRKKLDEMAEKFVESLNLDSYASDDYPTDYWSYYLSGAEAGFRMGREEGLREAAKFLVQHDSAWGDYRKYLAAGVLALVKDGVTEREVET